MKEKLGLTGSQLKWIAILTMLCDHMAKIIQIHLMPTASISAEQVMTFYRYYGSVNAVLLFLGRFAFPIFCFLLVEGFIHTSNLKKYILRLFGFALISEVPFDLAFFNRWVDFRGQNVFFTLLIGLVTIACLEGIKRFEWGQAKVFLVSLLVIGGGVAAAELMQTDYGGWIGVLMIVALYLLRDYPLLKCLFGALIILQNSWIGPLAFVLIYLYNGKKGRQWKYFFYFFYPVHLLVLVALQSYLIQPYLDNLRQLGNFS